MKLKIFCFLFFLFFTPTLGWGQTTVEDFKLRPLAPPAEEVQKAPAKVLTPKSEKNEKWRQKILGLGKEKREQKKEILAPQEPPPTPVVPESKPETPGTKDPGMEKKYQKTGRTTVVD